MHLINKTVLVTGASGGIGSVLCSQLAERGVRLIMSCTDVDKLQALKSLSDQQHIRVAADISSVAGRSTIVQACAEAGGIDAVINLAGMLNFALFQDQDPVLLEKMLMVNTLAPIMLVRRLMPLLLERGEGRILNVGSVFGSIGHPGFAAYCGSKAAIKTFSEALARELADTAVSVAYIAPRATRTAMNNDRVRALNAELGNKEDSPELVARKICELLASSKRQRFLGWPEKLFVLLNAVLPAVVHKALVAKLPVIKKYAQ